MRRLSIRHKLLFLLLATVLIYAVLSAALVNRYVRGMLKDHYLDMGTVLSSTMAANVVNDVLIGDFVAVHSYFEGVMENNREVSYAFIEKDGEVLVHTFKEGFPQGLLDVGRGEGETGHVLVRDGDRNYYDFSAPVFGGRTGTLRLGMSGGMIEHIMGSTMRAILYIALAAVAAALVFSLAVSRRFTRPLELLTSSAREIAHGNYSRVVEAGGEDEIGALAGSFNAMAASLKAREEKLREMNRELLKARQDAAVVETTRAMLHHLRQPLTYLIMAIELFIEDLQKDDGLGVKDVSMRLEAVEEAGQKVAEVLRKFENLKEYRPLSDDEKTGIIDIG